MKPAAPPIGRAETRAIDTAFAEEQRAGALLGLRTRIVGIAIIAGSLFFRVSGDTLAYYLAILAVLLFTGWVFYLTTVKAAGRLGRAAGPLRALLVLIDVNLITWALVIPAPGLSVDWPAAMQLRLGDVGFLFVFLAFSALTYAPGLALWAGFAAAGAWLGGVAWTLAQPGSFTKTPAEFAVMEPDEGMVVLLDPAYVSVIAAVQEALLLAITGAVIAAAVWRGRRQALRQITAARERTKLARYFSPDLAEELAHGAEGLETQTTRQAAVLFADIVAFTGHAERMNPEETIAFLREFHARATSAVFAHRGTLNKFIGDEVMASFGAIHPMEDASAAAIETAFAIADSISEWSAVRVAAGFTPVRVGVGVHIGPVVVGNIGDERCLELAVLGDVVNVASRLQQATRAHDACVVVSRDVVDAARGCGSGSGALSRLDGSGAAQAAELRGRAGVLDILVWRDGGR